MSETNFTKGKWVAKTEIFGGLQIGVVYIENGGFDLSGAPDAVANAHLIAAAPEMYDLLECLATHQEYDLAKEIKELLAKARGEA